MDTITDKKQWKCISGKHNWDHKEDAQKCCNGYKQILRINGDVKQQYWGKTPVGKIWVKEDET